MEDFSRGAKGLKVMHSGNTTFWVGRRLVANHSATLPCPMAFAEEG